MDYEEKLNEYVKKYLKKDYSEILQLIRDIISDVQYFKAHIKRTQRTTPYSFELRLSWSGCIHNFFFQKIDVQIMNDALQNEESLMRLLKIYYLLVELIEPIAGREEERKDEDVKKLIEFSEVVNWFLGLKLHEYMVAFIGCSSTLESIYSHINRLKK